jgi:hypothetical protein
MSQIIAQAPVQYAAGYTSVAGTAEQIIQTNAAAKVAGIAPGNFYLDVTAEEAVSSLIKVKASGTIQAHGATQTVAMGLLYQAWSGTSRASNPVDTFTPVASAALVAGNYYDFSIEQEFFCSSALSGILCATGLPVVTVGGIVVNVTTGIPSALSLPNLLQTPYILQAASGGNTGPAITGPASSGYVSNAFASPNAGVISTTPIMSFAVSIKNSVSDAVETVNLNSFFVEA